jgi:hypothetical protein
VPLTGSDNAAWTGAFQTVNGWLSQETRGGVWGAVTLNPDTITVEQVEEGSEDALRQFLDGLVQQTERELERRRADEAQQNQSAGDDLEAQREADERMAERFRDTDG